MSATDELRRLLDERGVPWRCYGYENHTWWDEWHAENRPSVNGLFLKVEGVVTPAQAVEATLGRGTCRVITIGEFNGEGTEYYDYCSNCGYEFDDDPPNYCPNCGKKVMES